MKTLKTRAVTDMKRLLIPLIACLLLSSCGTQHTDYITSNTGEGATLTPIIPSGSGYYYNDNSNCRLALKYYDIASDKSIYLCSRPECTHDGNEFCNATSRKYVFLGMAEYEGELYIEACEYRENESVYKLLRAEKDGTGLSEISAFAKQQTDGDNSFISVVSHCNPVIHRGKAYLTYRLERDNSVSTWGIAEVDICTGVSKIILEEKSDGYMDHVSACGDDLFFMLFSRGDYNFDYILYHYDIKSGETKELVSPQNYPREGTAHDGRYIYTAFENNKYGVYSYDPKTNSTELLDNPISAFFSDSKGGLRLKYDGNYWYACKNIRQNVETYRFAIFSDSFERLAEFDVPGENTDISPDILDGILYLQYYSRVLKCPVDDILKENIHWDEAYRFDRKIDRELEENAEN